MSPVEDNSLYSTALCKFRYNIHLLFILVFFKIDNILLHVRYVQERRFEAKSHHCYTNKSHTAATEILTIADKMDRVRQRACACLLHLMTQPSHYVPMSSNK